MSDKQTLAERIGLDTAEMEADELKEIRTRCGAAIGRHVTQSEFSDVIGCRPTGVSEYENGSSIPQSMANAARLVLRVVEGVKVNE